MPLACCPAYARTCVCCVRSASRRLEWAAGSGDGLLGRRALLACLARLPARVLVGALAALGRRSWTVYRAGLQR